jgi:3-dehydroquinate synthase
MDPLRVTVPGGAPYDIVIEEGSLSTLAERAVRLLGAHRYAVIADSQVARLLGDRVVRDLEAVDVRADLFEFPAGEWNKSRDEWAVLSDRMLRAGLGRDAAVVALGGGVTGDLAGFVAATYMRGVPVVQVPTTLLAMLDSSVGGKTGVDTEAGKNLIGAFHHPALVVIDPEVLATLPRMQRLAGLAEAIKTAAILDRDLWNWIEERADRLADGEIGAQAELVRRTLAHKAGVVAADPLEVGLRAILNFGHTVGHAIETLEGYTILHGEAVAAGMRVEARLGEILGVTRAGTADRIEALLEACGLDRPWETERRHDEIAEAMMLDKKSRAARPRCVFLESIGTVARDSAGRYTTALEDDALEGPLADALRPGFEP